MKLSNSFTKHSKKGVLAACALLSLTLTSIIAFAANETITPFSDDNTVVEWDFSNPVNHITETGRWSNEPSPYDWPRHPNHVFAPIDAPTWDQPGSWTALDDYGNPLVVVVAPDGTIYVPPSWAEVHANRSPVLVNGREIVFEAFTIGGSNYFKLRDLAFALNGTEKQFEVSFDSMTGIVSMISGQPYTIVGGEMENNPRASQSPSPSNSRILLDGNELSFSVWNIGGKNYFRLRDIAYALDFSVVWEDGRILVDTEMPTISMTVFPDDSPFFAKLEFSAYP